MVHLGEVPQNLLKFLSKAASLVLLIVCFFILQYLFDLDFICSCKPDEHLHDVLFLAVPPLVLTSVVFLIQSFYQKAIFSSRCHDCCNNFCSFFVKFLFQYLCLGVVWTSAVLFDGDWYFCLKTNLNSAQTGIPCREKLTYNETLIKTGYKNDSLDWGFVVIGAAFGLWSIVECFKPCIGKMCCRKRSVEKKLCGDLLFPPYYKWFYEDLLSKEVSCHLENELKKIAQEKAKRLCKEHLTAIRNHELPEQITNQDASGNTQADPWQDISSSYFY